MSQAVSAMRTVRHLDAARVLAEGWAEAILALDRENMAEILAAVGLDFPEERRRQALAERSTVVIVLESGGTLDGYVEMSRDERDADGVYLSSIQVRRWRRGGISSGILLVECADVLKSSPFLRLRSEVQASNAGGIALFRKLGFELRARPGGSRTLDVLGDRKLLGSPILRRLEAHLGGKYERQPSTVPRP